MRENNTWRRLKKTARKILGAQATEAEVEDLAKRVAESIRTKGWRTA